MPTIHIFKIGRFGHHMILSSLRVAHNEISMGQGQT